MSWDDVLRVILVRWPAGPGNKPWDPDILKGYLAELQEDKLTPDWAIVGLRASTSDFIPAVGRVRALAREAMGPPTAAQIEAAERRHAVEQRRRAVERKQITPPEPPQ